jgi:cytoskeletal protein RodZ
VSIGDTLAAARRQAGLTITQVSQRTCIRETIVRGIERGDYSACGGDFYARGHIRSIARAVGLEPEELIREYDATQAPPQPVTAKDVFRPFTPVKIKERRRPNWSVVLLVGVVAVLGVGGYTYYHTHHHTTPPRPTAANVPSHHDSKSPAATKQVSHTAPTDVHLRLVAQAGNVTWAEATTSSGRVLFQGDVTSGTQMNWTQKHQITLQLGNPGGARLYLNGKREPFSETTRPLTVLCTPTSCTTTQVA